MSDTKIVLSALPLPLMSVRLPTIQLTIHLSIHHLPFVLLGVDL